MHKAVAVIPCYNHPQTIGVMVAAVYMYGLIAMVVDDGSDDVCARTLNDLAVKYGNRMQLVRLAQNQGKGAAVMAGLRAANAGGFTHVLQIDADGQHDVDDIPKFLALSLAHPDTVICGEPFYDASVPKARLYGRYATHIWVWINTLSLDIRDSMCGFRVYPLAPVVKLIDEARLGKRMDFDPELLVRLHWRGVPMLSMPTKVSYPFDGISHFKLLWDNLLISGMHTRLFLGMLIRSPSLIWRKLVT
jgi:glycosyltransferase involved in cell wall biosynthesis